MRSDRLLKLADFLETVPRRAFDLENWVERKATKPEGKRPGQCGFAGCAVGWAAHAKLFRGFKIVDSWPEYAGTSAWHAVGTLFDLPMSFGIVGEAEYKDAEFLFSDTSYDTKATPKQVAKRIRKFVADHKGAK